MGLMLARIARVGWRRVRRVLEMYISLDVSSSRAFASIRLLQFDNGIVEIDDLLARRHEVITACESSSNTFPAVLFPRRRPSLCHASLLSLSFFALARSNILFLFFHFPINLFPSTLRHKGSHDAIVEPTCNSKCLVTGYDLLWPRRSDQIGAAVRW